MNNEQKEQMMKTNAFYNVSFDPEKRLERFISDIENEDAKIDELCQQYGVDSQKFKDKHFRLALDYLYAQSRCLSWAITGPARFPVKTQEKRQATCEDRLNRLVNFENNIEKYLKKITHQVETQDDKKDNWLKKIEALKARQDMMKDVNKLIRQGKKCEAEEKYNVKLEPNWLGNYGFESYELRNNLANIKRLEEQVKTIDCCREKSGLNFEFAGGKVEYDAEEIRYNIFFDEKPDDIMRTKLKSHGFKWSPRRGAWTRSAKTINSQTIKKILEV